MDNCWPRWACLRARRPILQRRAIYHSFQFAAFTLFWTVTPLAADRADLSPVAVRRRVVRSCWCGRGHCSAYRRPNGGSRLEPARDGPGDAGGCRGIPDHPYRRSRDRTSHWDLLVAAAILLDFGITTTLVTGPARHLRAGARDTRTAQRPLYDHLVHRRSDRFGRRRHGPTRKAGGSWLPGSDWRFLWQRCCTLRPRSERMAVRARRPCRI